MVSLATSTSNYRLTKPDGTDLVDIDELNGNFDIIDRQLKANADAAAGKQDKLVFDTAPMSGSTKPVTSGGIYTALGRKQDKLTFDTAPVAGSQKPVTSGGIFTALGNKQDKLTFDSAPAAGSQRPVTSGGVFTALGNKQDKLTFDTAPAAGSQRPVTSGGIFTALGNKQDSLTFDSSPRQGSSNPVRSGGVFSALQGKQDDLTKVPFVSSLLETDYLFLERNGRIYKIRASAVIIPSGEGGDGIETESGEFGQSIRPSGDQPRE